MSESLTLRSFGVNRGGGDAVGGGRDDYIHAGGEAAELRRLAVDGDFGRGRHFVFFGRVRRVKIDRDRHEMDGGDFVARVSGWRGRALFRFRFPTGSVGI